MGEASRQPFGPDVLRLDAAAEVERIGRWLRTALARDLRRRGLVVAMSGGVDSTVTAALAVRALGAERVFGLLMPERQADPETVPLSRHAAEQLGITHEHQDITPILQAVGFYERYEAAVRQVVPDYGPGWRSKIVTADAARHTVFTFFTLVTLGPSGESRRDRLPLRPYLEIVAATSFKQRIRKMLEYYHADRLNYGVAGTPNRLEYDQGFYVKNGDGSADVKPLAHLYKSQVYQLAEHLGVPEAIRRRPPTTDTYSLAQGQDEFYFGVPYPAMDLCLYGKNHAVAADAVAAACGVTTEQVRRVWADIDAKRAATRYLRLPPLLAEPVPELSA
jgi:NAD+ synthase